MLIMAILLPWTVAVAEVPVVTNPAAATVPPVVIHPRQLWHVGASDDPDTPPLGHILDVATDAEGNAYLLDESLVLIHVVGLLGDDLGNLGREGQGPGEFEFPQTLGFLPDGRLGVSLFLPGRIVLLDRQGDPRGTFALPEHGGGLPRIWRFRGSADRFVVSYSTSRSDARTTHTVNRLDLFGGDAGFLATLLRTTRETRSQGMSIDTGRESNGLATCWDLAPDGRVFAAPEYDAYEVHVYDRDGAPQSIIRRPSSPVPHTPEHMAELRAQREDLQRFEGESVSIHPYQRAITSLSARPDGSLWVLSSQGLRDCPPAHLGVFHVFDREGHYRHDLTLSVDYDPARDRFRLDGNRLYILKEALMKPATRFTARYGNSLVAVANHPPRDFDPEAEPRPYSVIAYELPQ